jgi:SAM-dependent methyltransferase
MRTPDHYLSALAAVSFMLLPALDASAVEPSFAPTQALTEKSLDVPYVPTPQAVVDKMLDIAKVTGGDYLIDLGSGDGRIPIAAAKRFGAKAIGVDINPARIQEAKTNAVNARVEDKVEFRKQDLFETDLSKATVLTLYLLPDVNLQLRPRILSELKPGTRVVSHNFDMGDWKPDRKIKVDDQTIYLWIVPERGRQRIADDPG